MTKEFPSEPNCLATTIESHGTEALSFSTSAWGVIFSYRAAQGKVITENAFNVSSSLLYFLI